MRIEQIEGTVSDVYYQAAQPAGGTMSARLEVVEVVVDSLPEECAALLVTSDLQGTAISWDSGESRLLGTALAVQFEAVAEHLGLPSPADVGVLLAGDFYSAPDADKRGATGDVEEVWVAFAKRFRWVSGVAGNHDRFGAAPLGRADGLPTNAHLLDGDCVVLDGVQIAGVSGILGDPAKKWGRRPEAEQIGHLHRVLQSGPELLILHEGPPGTSAGQPGSAILGDALKAYRGLVICGHSGWTVPLHETIAEGPQVLNTDGRAFLLREAR